MKSSLAKMAVLLLILVFLPMQEAISLSLAQDHPFYSKGCPMGPEQSNSSAHGNAHTGTLHTILCSTSCSALPIGFFHDFLEDLPDSSWHWSKPTSMPLTFLALPQRPPAA